MALIAHISDLHFGRERPVVVEHLLADIRLQQPDIIAVSGDLTERAFQWQYRSVRAFLDRLPAPWIAAAGNHDVPLLPLGERIHAPLRRFATYVDNTPTPVLQNSAVWIAALHTAHGRTWKDGRIPPQSLHALCEAARRAPSGVRRIVVAHHPFAPPPDDPGYRLVEGWAEALKHMADAGIDMVLGGHVHRAYVLDVKTRASGMDRSLFIVQAPTATSPHVRDTPNGYNLIRVEGDRASISTRYLAGRSFRSGQAQDLRFVAPSVTPEDSARAVA